MVREMLRQRVVLNEQITAFDQQIRNFGCRRPSHELVARRNEVVNAYNGLGDQIRLLQTGPGADPGVQGTAPGRGLAGAARGTSRPSWTCASSWTPRRNPTPNWPTTRR